MNLLAAVVAGLLTVLSVLFCVAGLVILLWYFTVLGRAKRPDVSMSRALLIGPFIALRPEQYLRRGYTALVPKMLLMLVWCLACSAFLAIILFALRTSR